MSPIGSQADTLKFGVLLLRYPRRGYQDMVPERVLSNAKNSEELDIRETIPDMNFNDGDIVLLTPERDKLLKLDNNNPIIEQLVEQMVENKTDVSRKTIQGVVADLAKLRAQPLISQLMQADFSEHEAYTIVSAMTRSLENPGKSKTHFDRIA
jgi:hypothetical protein